MKKISFILPMIALIIGVAASAFTHKPTRAANTEIWFVYDGNGDSEQADSYSIAPNNGEQPDCPILAAKVCAISANEDGNTGMPLQSDLDQRVSSSNHFTQSASGVLYKPL